MLSVRYSLGKVLYQQQVVQPLSKVHAQMYSTGYANRQTFLLQLLTPAFNVFVLVHGWAFL